jgi:hypothetical protein
MKLLLLLVIVAAGGFFGYPLINEDSSSECDALERIAVRTFADTKDKRPQAQGTIAEQVIGQLLQGTSKGQFAQVAVRNQFPDLPVGAACALLYWKALVDPEGFRKDPTRLRPGS